MLKKCFVKAGIISIVMVLCITSSVYAAIHDQWGPNWYTPSDAHAKATSTYWKGYNMKWSADSVSSYAQLAAALQGSICWELECRPNSGHPDDYWNGESSFSSNLPYAYSEYEGDGDDVSIGCAAGQYLSSDTVYSGTLYMNSNATELSSYTLESEHGLWLGIDGYPLSYEWFRTDCKEGTTYFWTSY